MAVLSKASPKRVVDGGAEPLIAADVVHDQQLGVPARDQQQQIGRPQALGEADGERVRLQMIDRDQRQAVHQRRCALAVMTPTSRPPISPGPAVTATASRLGKADAGLAHGLRR